MNNKAQTGPAAVLHAIALFLTSGFLIYFLIPILDGYRLTQIAYYQVNPDLFSPMILIFFYILIPFIWATWAFIGTFYIINTTRANKGSL